MRMLVSLTGNSNLYVFMRVFEFNSEVLMKCR